MEYKEGVRFGHQDDSTVLIETLWNVKRFIKDLCNGIDTVLIETLWNVKKKDLPTHVTIRSTGINRNIVECKVLWY